MFSKIILKGKKRLILVCYDKENSNKKHLFRVDVFRRDRSIKDFLQKGFFDKAISIFVAFLHFNSFYPEIYQDSVNF